MAVVPSFSLKCGGGPSAMAILSTSGRKGTSLGASASLSWSSSLQTSSLPTTPGVLAWSSSSVLSVGITRAAWTRRSRNDPSKKTNRKSWKQRTDMYMRPFLLDIFFSRRFIHAKVMHRGTCKVISSASTNAADIRYSLPSLVDDDACWTIGQLIAERCKEADVFAVAYEPGKKERIEGKIGIIISAIKENGIIFVE
ncbi:uncharacterized protein LOC144708894 [Wolffia australiana]